MQIDMREFDQLQKTFMKLGKFPTAKLTSAVKANAKPVKEQAIANIASTSKGTGDGDMIKSIVIAMEKAKKTGKRVATIGFADNPKFKKGSGYYPVSQEYGYITRSGRKIEGRHFLRKALESQAPTFSRKVFAELMSYAEKEWRKR